MGGGGYGMNPQPSGYGMMQQQQQQPSPYGMYPGQMGGAGMHMGGMGNMGGMQPMGGAGPQMYGAPVAARSNVPPAAPKPASPWTEHRTDSGDVYYYNSVTKVSQVI